MRKWLMLLIFVCLGGLITACNRAGYEITGYTASSINTQFPVPTNAKQINLTTNSGNPNIKVAVTYELKNIGGELGLYPPSDYFQKLAEEGWIEIENERLGHVHFLQKEDRIIALEIREDTFQIHEMKPDFKFKQK
ncbi:hypothetical protein ASD24_25810 [Paenibacillus sp. Root52]|uniref:hypothetical protein n=1 Tax=Paenibacillus sp. Root52 TaxID=1736552 RepID=UPI000701290E|nr:hypothetical protein [Paenibacillus sp. Root52]KQY88140.1 hypothetical protein ASD24_25810 [Paenibacillus sp. Root52]